jgi:hypothetical protein
MATRSNSMSCSGALAACLLPWFSLLACGGRTAEPIQQGRDGGAGRSDSAVGGDGGSFDGKADTKAVADADSAAVLPDGSSCAKLRDCCSFLPQVDQHNCLYETQTMINESFCQGDLFNYIQDGDLDGGPCVGEGHGTPACASLVQCCGFLPDPIECSQIADAGNQDACVTTFWTDKCTQQ